MTDNNAHHPKPELSAMDYAEIVAFEAARATRAEQKCDELRSLIEGQKEHVSKSQRERDRWKAATKRALEHRDEWKARAELENARLERDGAFENYKRMRRERDAAVERAEQAERERDIAETYRRTVERQAMDLGMAHLEKGGEQ